MLQQHKKSHAPSCVPPLAHAPAPLGAASSQAPGGNGSFASLASSPAPFTPPLHGSLCPWPLWLESEILPAGEDKFRVSLFRGVVSPTPRALVWIDFARPPNRRGKGMSNYQLVTVTTC
eukprot:4200777-Amphidinium_carterae.1